MAVTTQNTISDSMLAAINGSTSKSASATQDQGDRFLKLLTTQLRNQDPLNPMDNAQMTSQLAQINMVDGLSKLNATLEKLVSGSKDSEALQAAALVGRNVLVDGKQLALSGGQAVGGFELTTPADAVTVSIRDTNGLTVRTLNLGAHDAGSYGFAWDGKSDSGATAADGKYTLSVSATQSGTAVSAQALELARVASVSRSTAGTSLSLGAQGVISLDDVKQIL